MKGFSKIILSLLLLTLSSSLFAQKKEVYISPNNDGIQDEFVLPMLPPGGSMDDIIVKIGDWLWKDLPLLYS